MAQDLSGTTPSYAPTVRDPMSIGFRVLSLRMRQKSMTGSDSRFLSFNFLVLRLTAAPVQHSVQQTDWLAAVYPVTYLLKPFEYLVMSQLPT